MLKLSGIVRVIYEHGEPHGIRDDSGFICFFNSVPKYSGQEDRYRQECEDRIEIADFLCESLSKADRK
jgi:protoheme ferro-lyase